MGPGRDGKGAADMFGSLRDQGRGTAARRTRPRGAEAA